MISKASAGVVSAAEISFFRWAVATLLLALLVWPALRREWAAVRTRLPRIVILGLLGCAVFPYMMYRAASYTSAIHLGLIQTLMPVLAICFARLLFGAAISRAALLGAAVSMIGVGIVVSHGDPLLLLAQPANRGDLIMIAATACFALYSVLLGRWRSDAVSPLVDLLGQSFVAMLAMLPLWWFSASSAVPTQGLWMIGYAGIFGSVAAPLLWIYGIARLGPSRAAPFFNILPLVTAALAIAFLGEALTVSLVIGGLLTIAGVVLAQRRT